MTERMRRCAHRRGIARILNEIWHSDGHRTAYVQTVLPAKVLAHFATRWRYPRVLSVARSGLLEWRWHLAGKP
jgi:hypothetical protein